MKYNQFITNYLIYSICIAWISYRSFHLWVILSYTKHSSYWCLAPRGNWGYWICIKWHKLCKMQNRNSCMIIFVILLPEFTYGLDKYLYLWMRHLPEKLIPCPIITVTEGHLKYFFTQQCQITEWGRIYNIRVMVSMGKGQLIVSLFDVVGHKPHLNNRVSEHELAPS